MEGYSQKDAGRITVRRAIEQIDPQELQKGSYANLYTFPLNPCKH